MPFYAINKFVVIFLLLYLPPKGHLLPSFPHFPYMEMYLITDKMTPLSFSTLDLVFKCPLWPLFIFKMHHFPFHKVYYFLTTLPTDLLSACSFSQKVSSFSPSGFRGSRSSHWKPSITVKDSNTVNIVIKAHLCWKLLFHLIKSVCPEDTEESLGPQ